MTCDQTKQARPSENRYEMMRIDDVIKRERPPALQVGKLAS
jgi:hypothetical protein